MGENLDGKVAIVTGAARRIGAATVRALHAAGARVLVHHRGAGDAEALVESLEGVRPGSAARVQADLLAPGAPGAIVEAALHAFGRIDILVNNASTFYPTATAAVTAAQWDDLLGSNLRAPFFLCQAAAPHLARAQGVIVNITDIHADRPLKGYPVYTAAKAGLAGLTRALAVELAPEVRVNAVAPGAIAWPEDGQFDPQERARIVSTTPLARVGSPEDIARAVLAACSMPFVTGQTIAVDGGRSVFL